MPSIPKKSLVVISVNAVAISPLFYHNRSQSLFGSLCSFSDLHLGEAQHRHSVSHPDVIVPWIKVVPAAATIPPTTVYWRAVLGCAIEATWIMIGISSRKLEIVTVREVVPRCCVSRISTNMHRIVVGARTYTERAANENRSSTSVSFKTGGVSKQYYKHTSFLKKKQWIE